MQLVSARFQHLRLKTYMRSTMADERLNNLMILHIHREKTDKLDLVDIANWFVGKNVTRKRMFGRFTERDLSRKREFRSVGTVSVGSRRRKFSILFFII